MFGRLQNRLSSKSSIQTGMAPLKSGHDVRSARRMYPTEFPPRDHKPQSTTRAEGYSPRHRTPASTGCQTPDRTALRRWYRSRHSRSSSSPSVSRCTGQSLFSISKLQSSWQRPPGLRPKSTRSHCHLKQGPCHVAVSARDRKTAPIFAPASATRSIAPANCTSRCAKCTSPERAPRGMTTGRKRSPSRPPATPVRSGPMIMP